MATLFTADTHFGHANIILTRPAFQTDVLKAFMRTYPDWRDNPDTVRGVKKLCIEALPLMEETLIANWNAVVSPEDDVYHLGDFTYAHSSGGFKRAAKILQRLNGRKYLIQGNHDSKKTLKMPGWTFTGHYAELKEDMGGAHKQRIVLSHYAMRVWNQKHRGAWMLYGHSHGNLPALPGELSMDVGVDANEYAPVSMWSVGVRMAKIEYERKCK